MLTSALRDHMRFQATGIAAFRHLARQREAPRIPVHDHGHLQRSALSDTARPGTWAVTARPSPVPGEPPTDAAAHCPLPTQM
jgi:hypothetical protein